jgi:Rod binding domain-containing protein
MDAGLQNIGDLAITQSAPVNLARMPGKGGNVDKASQDFEGMFMTQMLQPMFEGLDVDPVFGGGQGEKVMRSFLVQEYGKIMSKGGHLGIAAAVKNEMIRAQGTPGAAGTATPKGTISAKDAARIIPAQSTASQMTTSTGGTNAATQ